MKTLKTATGISAALLAVALSSVLIAEAGLGLAAGGGHRALNNLAADPILGLRFEPSSQAQLRAIGAEPVRIEINSLGHRGPELPPGGAKVWVLGDGLSLGPGVEFSHTFSALLGAAGLKVRNLSVPGYGPLEFEHQVHAGLGTERPEVVVLALNLGRHLSTWDQPLRELWTAEAGWRVRAPGGRSDGLMPQSEGFGLGAGSVWTPVLRGSHLLDWIRRRRAGPQSGQEAAPSDPNLTAKASFEGDIPSHLIPARKATMARWNVLKQQARVLQEARQAHAGTPQGLTNQKGKPRAWSPLTPLISRIRDRVEALDGRLVVLVLPPDVSLGLEQWAKYGLTAKETRLIDKVRGDLGHSIEALGITVCDPSARLMALDASPYRAVDWHLNQVGHGAVAAALQEALARPAPPRRGPEHIPQLPLPPPL